MKIAVLSDIHDNLEALQTVLEKIHALHLDEVVCLGDNIGYGPDSQVVMDLLAEHKIASVLGNHEMAVKNRASLKRFNPMAQKALEITRSQLSGPAVSKIRKPPFFLVYDTQTCQLSVMALACPFADTGRKIIAAGIPKIYAEKLAVGAGGRFG